MTLEEALRKISGRENLHLYEHSAHMKEWEQWYKGKVDDFHPYKYYNGKKYIPDVHYSLGMAKRVCEDWANLLINEKTDITLDSGEESEDGTATVNNEAQEQLNKVFKRCHFWRKANIGIEQSFALSMGGLYVHVDNLGVDEYGEPVKDKAVVKVSFANGTKVRPITIEDGEVTECAFVSVSSDNKKSFITMHVKDEASGNYIIYNVTAHGMGEMITYNPDEVITFNTLSDIPWFAILQPNIANNIDPNSPLGISIFANSIDNLKAIDLIYDSYRNEFRLGRKRVFISVRKSSMTVDLKDPNASGAVRTFDDNDGIFYQLPDPEGDDTPLIQDDTQELRVQAHIDGLQQQLNYLSYSCGFGTNHYKFDGGSIATATQIVSENSDLFRNIKKHEILIEDVLITIVKAVIYASNTFTNEPINADPEKIKVKFDDSIIEDKESEKQSDRSDVSMGIMGKAEFRAKWYGEDENTAKAKIAEIESSTIDDYDLYLSEQDGENKPKNGENKPKNGENNGGEVSDGRGAEKA